MHLHRAASGPLPPGFTARAAHPDGTLADLYDSHLIPPNLRRAHQALDRAVDRCYRRTRFTTERERVEHLFALYERLQAPLAAKSAPRPRTRRRRLQPRAPYTDSKP